MTTVSTEDRISEIERRLLEPGITEAQIEKLKKILATLREKD